MCREIIITFTHCQHTAQALTLCGRHPQPHPQRPLRACPGHAGVLTSIDSPCHGCYNILSTPVPSGASKKRSLRRAQQYVRNLPRHMPFSYVFYGELDVSTGLEEGKPGYVAEEGGDYLFVCLQGMSVNPLEKLLRESLERNRRLGGQVTTKKQPGATLVKVPKKKKARSLVTNDHSVLLTGSNGKQRTMTTIQPISKGASKAATTTKSATRLPSKPARPSPPSVASSQQAASPALTSAPAITASPPAPGTRRLQKERKAAGTASISPSERIGPYTGCMASKKRGARLQKFVRLFPGVLVQYFDKELAPNAVRHWEFAGPEGFAVEELPSA